MNETDLYTYKDAKRRKEAAMERLAEFEAAMYSPGAQKIDGMPFEKNRTFYDRLPDMMDEHQKLIDAVNDCSVGILRGWVILNRAAAVLTDAEAAFLDCRYRYCLTWGETEIKMHFSRQSLSRMRQSIIEKIRNI